MKKSFNFLLKSGLIGSSVIIIFHFLIAIFDSVNDNIARALINFGISTYALYPSLLVARGMANCIDYLSAEQCLPLEVARLIGIFADVILWFILGLIVGLIVLKSKNKK